VRVIDSQGAAGPTSTRAIRIDVTAPSAVTGLDSSTHPIATEWYANPYVAFSWNASTDATSGVAGYSYVMDQVATTVPDTTSETAATSTSFGGRTDGTWYFHIRAVDLAGNATAAISRTAKVDTTPPVTAQSGSDGAWHDQDVVVSFTPTDIASGVVGGLARTEWSTDAGETWTQSTWVVVPAPLGGGNDGIHEILYHSYDKLGNTESIKSCTVKIDTLWPVSTLGETPIWTNTELTVPLTAVDDGCGVASKQYRFDGGLWAKGSSVTIPAPSDHSFDGVHTIDYRSIDALFNTETPQTRTIGVDTEAPSTSNDYDGVPRQLVAVDLTAVDGVSGVVTTQYRIDGGVWRFGTSVVLRAKTIRHKLGCFSAGDHLIEYRSTDAAGNVEPIRSVIVTIG
jgi:large repetitive protein